MGELVEAGRVIDVVSGFDEQVAQLKLAISYSVDQMSECKRLLRSCRTGSAEALQNEGCILYKEGAFAYVTLPNACDSMSHATQPDHAGKHARNSRVLRMLLAEFHTCNTVWHCAILSNAMR